MDRIGRSGREGTGLECKGRDRIGMAGMECRGLDRTGVQGNGSDRPERLTNKPKGVQTW